MGVRKLRTYIAECNNCGYIYTGGEGTSIQFKYKKEALEAVLHEGWKRVRSNGLKCPWCIEQQRADEE